MMQRPRTVQLVALAACVVLLGAAGSRVGAINAGRQALNMYGAESPVRNAPPEFAFAIQAFGAFRGLIVDIAFIRAEEYKNAGRYFDAMSLHKMICALQPYFPAVWEYMAWNMSWNISVTTYTWQERWNWVYAGIKLLRDQGIPFNPRAVNLYKQIAWTFNNKMGEVTDEFHETYKINWAWRMHLLLGPPESPFSRVDLQELAEQADEARGLDAFLEAARRNYEINQQRRREQAEEYGTEFQARTAEEVALTDDELRADPLELRLAKQAARERLVPIAAAPRRLDELYARHPATADMVAQLRGLEVVLSDDALSEDEYWRPGGLAFTFFERYRKLKEPTTTFARVRTATAGPEATAEEQALARFDEILGVTAGNPAGEALVRWLQRKVLTEVYKLEPEFMQMVIDEFGPVDWRAADSQSLYWVTRGLTLAGETPSRFINDKTNTARILFFSLRNLFLRNRIIFEPHPEHERIDRSYLNVSHDLNFVKPMHEAFLKYGPLFDPKGAEKGTAGDTYRTGHRNFLIEAIRLLYVSGREAEAGYLYAYLQKHYRTNEIGEVNLLLAKPLHDFVMDDYKEMMRTPGRREARIALYGLIERAYGELALGNTGEYAHIVGRAGELYEEYMRDKRSGRRMDERIALPPFPDIQADVLLMYLGQPAVSAGGVVHKIRLWRAVPLPLRWRVYDWLRPTFEAECEALGFDVARAFPEPRDMQQYRETEGDRYRPDIAPDDVETLPQSSS